MKYNFFIISALCLVFSCTSSVDLAEVFEEKIVIEGLISEGNPAAIRLSKSVSATAADEFPGVEDAVVELIDFEGNTELLVETDTGYYTGNTLKGQAGKDYQLVVSIGGEKFVAKAEIPFPTLEITTLMFENIQIPNPPFVNQILFINYQKVANEVSYCRIFIYINDILYVKKLFKHEDDTEQPLIVPFNDIPPLQSNDVIRVEIEQMEEWLYNYLQNIEGNDSEEIISGLLIGPPDNLSANIDGDALGYFGATTNSFLELVVP